MISQRTSGLYHLGGPGSMPADQYSLLVAGNGLLPRPYDLTLEAIASTPFPTPSPSLASWRRPPQNGRPGQPSSQGHRRDSSRIVPPDPLCHGAPFHLFPHRANPAARLAVCRRLLCLSYLAPASDPLAAAGHHHQVRLQRLPRRTDADRRHARESLRTGPLSRAQGRDRHQDHRHRLRRHRPRHLWQIPGAG